MLTWGDVVVAWKRVPFAAQIVPREHFALPEELSPHALEVRATVAEGVARPPRFRIDRAFGLAVIAALLTHVAVGWLSVTSPDDEGEVLTGERLAAVRAASVDRSDGLTEGAPRAARAAAPIAYGVATATRGSPTPDDTHDAVEDVAVFGMVGLLDSVTRPLCGTCNRLRLTADGQWRNCLFAHQESDLRTAMRDGETDQQLAQRMQAGVATKRPGHGIDDPSFLQPPRPMSAIGG